MRRKYMMARSRASLPSRRFILKEPFWLNREDDAYSPVEMAIWRALQERYGRQVRKRT
ncbi:hypothetical protein V3H18_13120 [Methylocystis sp. 9N]|uniref:Uncharacterized protein n=1 Tax=Methylocystis borbori TaxID=3118750 RepID=A0ABU7XJW9_9HYPH